MWDFPGGPAVGSLPCNAGAMGSIPGRAGGVNWDPICHGETELYTATTEPAYQQLESLHTAVNISTTQQGLHVPQVGPNTTTS